VTEPPRLRSICVAARAMCNGAVKTVTTSIFKAPVTGRVRVDRLNLAATASPTSLFTAESIRQSYVYPSSTTLTGASSFPNFRSRGALSERTSPRRSSEKDISIETVCGLHREFEVTSRACRASRRFDRADMVSAFASGRSGSTCECSRKASCVQAIR